MAVPLPHHLFPHGPALFYQPPTRPTHKEAGVTVRRPVVRPHAHHGAKSTCSACRRSVRWKRSYCFTPVTAF